MTTDLIGGSRKGRKLRRRRNKWQAIKQKYSWHGNGWIECIAENVLKRYARLVRSYFAELTGNELFLIHLSHSNIVCLDK